MWPGTAKKDISVHNTNIMTSRCKPNLHLAECKTSPAAGACLLLLPCSRKNCATVSCAPQLLLKLAEKAQLREKIEAMFAGEQINSTEDRAVLHVATRARRDQVGKRRGGDVWRMFIMMHGIWKCTGVEGTRV